jgi:hypothetical protein
VTILIHEHLLHHTNNWLSLYQLSISTETEAGSDLRAEVGLMGVKNRSNGHGTKRTGRTVHSMQEYSALILFSL